MSPSEKGHLCPECGELTICEEGSCKLPTITRCLRFGCELDWQGRVELPAEYRAARNVYPGLKICGPDNHLPGYWDWLVWQAFRPFTLMEQL